jgi:hypothetical protein
LEAIAMHFAGNEQHRVDDAQSAGAAWLQG